MKRVATVSIALLAAAMVTGCGVADGSRAQVASGASEFSVLAGGDPLPEGHPPLDWHHRSLPEGHPPVPGYGEGLPEGHPVCPAGRALLERGGDGAWTADDTAPAVISI